MWHDRKKLMEMQQIDLYLIGIETLENKLIKENSYGPVHLQNTTFIAPNQHLPHHHFKKIAKTQNENKHSKSKFKKKKKTKKTLGHQTQ